MITGMHNAVLQRLHPQVELPLARPYLDKFDKARTTRRPVQFSLWLLDVYVAGDANNIFM